jgi:hypothetical protein
MPTQHARVPVTSCHAAPRCRRAPCFRLELHDPSGTIIGGKVADACADHLGDAVQALARWAAVRHLTAGYLQACAIDGPPGAGLGQQEPLLASFPFASIPLAAS